MTKEEYKAITLEYLEETNGELTEGLLTPEQMDRVAKKVSRWLDRDRELSRLEESGDHDAYIELRDEKRKHLSFRILSEFGY